MSGIKTALCIVAGCALAPGAALLANAPSASAALPPASSAVVNDATGGAPLTFAPGTAAKPPRYATDHVLVRFSGQDTSTQRAEVAGRAHGHITENFARVPGLAKVQLANGTSVNSAIASLRGQPGVMYAEPDYVVSDAATTPNDTDFPQEWGLNNTGQTVDGVAGTPGDDISATKAWDLTTGSTSIKVAVIDTGIAIDHPDLAANIWTNPGEIAGNGVDDDHNGFVDDVHGWNFVDNNNNVMDENGHGTHVAGTIGAIGNNDTAGSGSTDGVGVNWHVSIIPVRVLDATGSGLVSDEVNGINYAVANGARVVNMSLSRAGGFSQAEHDAIANATNTLFAVAAGNESKNLDLSPDYPCSLALPNMICVAASDSNDNLASFSNIGSAVNISAPGVNVLSTWPWHSVMFDNIETLPTSPRWTTGGTPNTWGATQEAYASPNHSLTDDPNNNSPTNENNWARRGPFNLSAYNDCRLGYTTLIDAAVGDNLAVETATSVNGPWTAVNNYPGEGDPGYGAFGSDPLPLSSTTYFRFHATTNTAPQFLGDFVDDVGVNCRGAYDGTNFAFLSGTSMATPHVAGAAALILSRFPALTVAQVRARILNDADVKASLSDVGGGRRLDVYTAVANNPPSLTVGPNQTVDTSSAVTLTASATDPDSDPITYTWTQLSGTTVALDDPHKASPKFTAPSTATTIQFQVTASTPTGPDVSGSVTITVKAPK
jgi:subtilisin family serine protease